MIIVTIRVDFFLCKVNTFIVICKEKTQKNLFCIKKTLNSHFYIVFSKHLVMRMGVIAVIRLPFCQ